jgi:hypothetical protein
VAADSLLQLGYLPLGRVKKRKNDADFSCHVPSPDRAEDKGRQSSIRQLPLLGRQFGLLVPQPSLPTIHVELVGQDLGTSVLLSFLLLLEVSLTMVEADLVGAQDLELAAEGDVVQLLPLL